MAEQVIFWDIDGTIVSSSLERHFLKYLISRDLTQPWEIAVNLAALSVERFPPKWYQIKLAYLRGKPASDVEKWIEECWEVRIRNNLYRGCIDAIRGLHDNGVRQVLISGTMRLLAEPLADYLGINDLIAGEPEIQDGKYTGALTEPHPVGARKLSAAEIWLSEHGYSWNDACALGNRWLDHFLLDRARTAIAVHPDKRLRRYALQKSWKVIDDTDAVDSVTSVIMSHNPY